MSYSFDSANGSVKSGAATLGSARVMCRQADGSLVLVRICRSLAGALAECSLLIDAHLVKLKTDRKAVLSDPQRPREVYVERWIGSVDQGAWVPAQSGDFNGPIYGRKIADGKVALCMPRVRFEFLDQPPRVYCEVKNSHGLKSAGAGNAMSTTATSTIAAPDLTKGAQVICLLTGRTKKGGWFAKLVTGDASGPVTNGDQMPSSLKIGQQVLLRLNGINGEGKYASFQWIAQPAG